MSRFLLFSPERGLQGTGGWLCLALAMLPVNVFGWIKTYGGTGSDGGACVIRTGDSGYIITGWRTLEGRSDSDLLLLRTDSRGSALWLKTYGGGGEDRGVYLESTPDSGYIILGNTSSFDNDLKDFDIWVLKVNSLGDTVWTRTYGGSNDDMGKRILPATDGYIIAGWTRSFGAGGQDMWLFEIDATGNKLWEKTCGGEYDDWANCMAGDSNSYNIIGGTQSFGNGGTDLWLLHAGPSGDTLWSATFGQEGWDEGFYVEPSVGGNYVAGLIIVGSTNSYAPSGDNLWLIRTGVMEHIEWRDVYGGDEDEWGRMLINTGQGYVVLGTTYSYGAGEGDLWLIKTTYSGSSPWKRTYGGKESDEGLWITPTEQEGFIITGYTCSSGAGESDLWLICTDSLGESVPADSTDDPDTLINPSWKVTYPVGKEITVEYEGYSQDFTADIFDALGRRVASLEGPMPSGVITWGEGYNPGVYFILNKKDTLPESFKLVLTP